MKQRIQKILWGDLLLLAGFILVMIGMTVFVLCSIVPLVSSGLRPLVIGAAIWCVAIYLIATISSISQLIKNKDEIYTEEILNRQNGGKQEG